MDTLALFKVFGLSLVLGALIGLEREWRQRWEDRHFFAGVRTFTLFALFGTTSALIAELSSIWFLLIAFLGFSAVITASAVLSSRYIEEPGLTTEISALLTALIGVLVYYELFEISVALAVGITVLLSIKPRLQAFAGRLEQEDLYATLKFAIITFIVLPVLPNEALGPFGAFNPYQTWLMVVLIAGLSFLGYVAIKVLGPRRGIGLTGMLGGFVSSTAYVLTYARRAREHEQLLRMFAFSIVLASTIMFPRQLIEVAIINPALLQRLWPPFAGMIGAGLLGCAVLWFQFDRTAAQEEGSELALRNPFRLTSALTIGALYAVITLLATAASQWFGGQGVLAFSALSGLTSTNTITLSLSNLSRDGQISAHIAAQGIVLASLVNTGLKASLVLALGGPTLFRFAGWAFGAVALAGLLLLWFV